MNYKLFLRSWFYFQKGYATYLNLPIALISVATTLYYLAIRSLPFLEKIFPKFHYFLLIFPAIYPIGVFLGWFHYRKSQIFQTEQEVITKSNPFSNDRLAPISLLTWTLFKAQAEELGLNDLAAKMDEIIQRSSP